MLSPWDRHGNACFWYHSLQLHNVRCERYCLPKNIVWRWIVRLLISTHFASIRNVLNISITSILMLKLNYGEHTRLLQTTVAPPSTNFCTRRNVLAPLHSDWKPTENKFPIPADADGAWAHEQWCTWMYYDCVCMHRMYPLATWSNFVLCYQCSRCSSSN